MNLYSHKKGFTLIEALVGSAIFLMLALSAYKAFGALMDAVTVSRAKLTATTIANEKFEIVRNLPYNDVGIVAGIPVGKIPRTVTVTRDGFSFTVESAVRSVDDTFDGTIGGSPSDTSPADYKLADLDITCSNCKVFSPLTFTTLVAPHALETASTNGALFIRVFDADGIAVPDADVHIVNTQTNPDTIIDEVTDNTGWFRIVDAPIGTNAYNVTATKTGFTTDKTYPLGGVAGPTPLNPDANVVLQQVTQTSLIIDQFSILNVSSVNSSCAVSPNVGFSLTGTKLIGTPAVLKYGTQNFTTNGSGTLALPQIEWDAYSLLLTSASFDLAGMSVLPNFTINPGETINLRVKAVPHTGKAVLISVKDSLGGPINGATVQLQLAAFNETKTTNSDACGTPGQVFWNGLTSGNYTLTVSAPGYDTLISTINTSPNWQHRSITLDPS